MGQGLRMNLEQRADNHLSDWSTAFGRNAIFTLTLIALGVSLYFQDLALGLPFDAIPLADHIGYMLRVTARIAFFLLLLAMIARPFRQLTGIGSQLLRHRRYLGLAMAFVHTVHFGYVIAFLKTSSEPLEMVTIIFGGLAFLLTWIMAATSNNAAQRALGVWWRRIHTLGIYYVWLIFMNTFIGTQLAEGDFIYTGIVAAGLVAVSLRIAVFLRQRFSRTA